METNATIESDTAKRFLKTFLTFRKVNRDFYSLLNEGDYDYKMTEVSDCPRKSLAHLINVENAYILGLKNGTLIYGQGKNELLGTEKKEKLLRMINEKDDELIAVLSQDNIDTLKIKVPWTDKKISAVDTLYGLNNHEILHIGWNLAVMDHLGIKRFESLKKVFG